MLSLGTLRDWPLAACTVDGDGVRWEAVEVRESAGVRVRGLCSSREAIIFLCSLGLGEIAITNHGGGGGSPCGLSLSGINARAEEFTVKIHWREREKTWA